MTSSCTRKLSRCQDLSYSSSSSSRERSTSAVVSVTAVLVCLFSASVGVPVARSTRYSHLRPSDEPAARSAFSLPANRLWITLYHLPPYAFISSFFSLCFADIARYMPCTWMLVSRCRFRHRWCDSLSLSRMCRVKDTRRQGLAERP